MNRVLLGLFLFFGATSICLADQKNDELLIKQKILSMLDKKHEIEALDRKCKTVYELAQVIMRSRQKGITLADQLNILDREISTPFPADLKEKERKMTMEVYDLPKFDTEGGQFLTTEYYALRSFLDCRENGL